MNIMQRLLLIVLLAALPVGFLQALSVRKAALEEQEHITLVATGIAERAAAEQRRVAEGARQMLAAIAQLPAVRDGDADACGLIMRRLKGQFAIYTTIGVASPSGRVWCSSSLVGTDTSDRPYFRRAVASGVFTTGGYVVGRVSKRRTLNFSNPFYDADGKLAGLLIVGLDLDRLAIDLGRTALPRSTSLAIFGPDRRAIVNLPGGAGLGGGLPARFEGAFDAAAPGSMHTDWFDGTDRLVAFVPPAVDREMPFLVMVGVDHGVAIAAVERNARRALGVLMMVVAAALLLAWWFAERYVRGPVLRLAVAVHAWRAGETTVRLGSLDPGSEFDDLARAFDDLADTVAERQKGLRDALESTTDLVIALSADWTVTYVNGRALAQLGGRDIMGKSIWDEFPNIADQPIGETFRRALADRRALSATFVDDALHGRFEANAYPAPDGGLIVFCRDVTEQYLAEREFRRLALTDPLTELPNRAQAFKIAGRKAASGALTALLVLDLDHFKDVNDSLGHPAGDVVLRSVAGRLSRSLGNDGVVARLGGDEFVVLLFKTPPERALALADQLLRTLDSEPFLVAGRLHHIGGSGGLVVIEGPTAASVEDLMANADLALYRAKAAGGGVCHRYDTADRDAYQARRQMEDDIAIAATTGQFELYFQPQVRLKDGTISGAEALLRWHHPQRGLLEPAAFIDMLEAGRHALPVGTWIIDEACRCASIWWRAGVRLRVSVNLFPQQARSRDLAAVVQATLRRHNLPPEALELELTENIALAVGDEVRGTLMALRMLGVSLALDDFGTGFASLTTLKSLPIDRLKIDRSFVLQLPHDEHDRAIVEAVLALGRTLGLQVVAEGIETAEQQEYLTSRGCQEAQGYRFGRAMPAHDLTALIDGPDRLSAAI